MRGHVVIKIEDCISCGLCVRQCPSQAIQVDKKAGTWKISRFDCVQCGNCVNVCPKKCLAMEKGYTKADSQKTCETFTRPKQEETRPTSGGKPAMDPEKCVYCTLCANKCPQNALKVDRKEKIWELNKEACIQCGICMSVCPKHAIEMKE